MRLASLAIALFLASQAFAITKVKVPTLPQSEWADTEVMTNVAINLSNSRTFDSDFYGANWLHSDMKDMAYFYVYPLYDELKTKGNLK